jgi:redox-sensitive bicupin YhaK (pirin superfamily)
LKWKPIHQDSPGNPHRGIETITYVIGGWVEHEDSLGNKGRLSSGDVQWMTAGSGIIHQEMPFDDGTIVMNMREELITAFREYDEGTYLKHSLFPLY